MNPKLAHHLNKHKSLWPEKTFLYNVFLGLLLLAIAIFLNSFANNFTLSHASNSVSDIILDNIPTFHVDLVFLEGAIIFMIFLAVVLLLEPKYIPFTLKSIALFVLVRSLFMILTHLAAPSHYTALDPQNILERMLAGSGDDLFFSGHTGFPFMLAFIFWSQKFFRYLFFLCTAIAGAAALLGHLHYSIDVFSALFIAFGIFHLGTHLFPRDYKLTLQ